MINCILCKNKSPQEKIGKTIVDEKSFNCVLKEKTSILHPTIKISTNENIYTYNYLRLPDFNRFYFIDDIVSITADIWEVSAHVDVLETYKTDILSNNAVIRRQQNKYNLYLDDSDFHTYNYEKLQTLQFPTNSFSKALQYILVVNGGQ